MANSFVIHGGRALSGKVKTQRAKNAILPIMAGAILCDGETIIEDCPKISDVLSMVKILKKIGCKAYFQEDNFLTAVFSSLTSSHILRLFKFLKSF